MQLNKIFIVFLSWGMMGQTWRLISHPWDCDTQRDFNLIKMIAFFIQRLQNICIFILSRDSKKKHFKP